MDKTPLVSVVIPVYNVDQYLHQCVDSVLSQSYKNIEVILVDDGSTDESGRICDDYAACNDSVIVIHKENAGLSEARNTGLSNASGEYISFIDSDDWIEFNNCSEMVELSLKHDSDFVFSDGLCFEDSEKKYNIKQSYKRKKQYASDKGIEVFRELQKNREFQCAVQFYLWSTSFLKKNRLLFYPGILYEDMLFTFRAFLYADNVSHCHKPLYHRRYRKGSIVTSKITSRNFLSACTVYREVSESSYSQDNACDSYCSRCAMKAIELYKSLSKYEKKICSEKYDVLKAQIKANKFHNDRALKARMICKPFWLIYKIIKKSTEKLT